MPGPLWEATRDLHHACEEHEVGAAMASGQPPIEWYARWLWSLREVHGVIDPYTPHHVRRVLPLTEDIVSTGVKPKMVLAATHYAESLTTDLEIHGAIYVMLGAGLMGGEVMRRRLVGYPVRHLEWENRAQAVELLREYRERSELAEPARACFAGLLRVMDEIRG
jgi:hypothetical protein